MRLLFFCCIMLLLGACRATKQSVTLSQSDTLAEAVISTQSRSWNRELIQEFVFPGLPAGFIIPPAAGFQTPQAHDQENKNISLPVGRSVKPGPLQTPVIIRQIVRESSADTASFRSEKKSGSDLITISTPSPSPVRPWRIFCAGVLCGVALSVIIVLLLWRISL